MKYIMTIQMKLGKISGMKSYQGVSIGIQMKEGVTTISLKGKSEEVVRNAYLDIIGRSDGIISQGSC